MITTVIPACKSPPHFWREDPATHRATCIKPGCGAVKDFGAAIKKFNRQPKGKSTPSEMDNPYFVPSNHRKAKKKATAY